MKHFIRLTLFSCVLLPLTLFSQQKKGFDVTGHLLGLNDGEKVILGNRFRDWHYFTPTDSCVIRDGHFYLKGEPVPEGPREYELYFANGQHRVRKTNGEPGNVGGMGINFTADNGDHVVIEGGDINRMKDGYFGNEVSITGSRSNTARTVLFPVAMKYWDQYGMVNNGFARIRDSIGFDYAAAEKVVEARLKLDRELDTMFLISPVDSLKPAFPFFTNFQNSYHAFYLMDMYNSLDEHTKKSFEGKKLKENARLAIGQPLPPFTLPDTEGKMIALKDVVPQNKITIVHLWGSNSWERDKYQNELKVFYQMYRGKGLGVIGVSADSVRNDWTFAIHQQNYPWINVSDLKGNLKGGMVNDVYHEGGHRVPNTTNILLDSKGRILAWDVSGVELQYYLRKYLGD